MTAAQTSLFDVVPDPLPVRRDDPPTSRAAARTVDAARKGEVLEAMAAVSRWDVGVTASEIHAELVRRGDRMESGAVRSRLNQLRQEDPPRVRKTGGVRCIAKPAGTGRAEQCWQLTPAGRAWLVGAVA